MIHPLANSIMILSTDRVAVVAARLTQYLITRLFLFASWLFNLVSYISSPKTASFVVL